MNYEQAKEKEVFSINSENKIEVCSFKDYLINVMQGRNSLVPVVEINDDTWLEVNYFDESNDLYKAPDFFICSGQVKMKASQSKEAGDMPPQITKASRVSVYDVGQPIFMDTKEGLFNYFSNICNTEYWDEPGFLRCTETREEQYSMMQVAFAEDDLHYQDFIQKNNRHHKNALILALMLAIQAPDEERVNRAVGLAEQLASGLSAAEVESGKSEALLRLEADDWPKLS
ncbi:hypothetical protein [Polynucleobacter sp. 31A-FELB]|uniref:hypothetical protein n=1 Tax=Polynucleobacter sp. 31A-FELB TaxID=2689096 RepID=UPI001C0BB6DA|nr:hypothetical protein [Polynucleobacter sp. 31A-FELB]